MFKISFIMVVLGFTFGASLPLLGILKTPPKEHFEALYSEHGLVESEGYPDLREILFFAFPAAGAPVEQWEDFKFRVDALNVGSRHRYVDITSPAVGFLGYFAKHNSNEFMFLVDTGAISDRVFSHFLKMGYLEDWNEYSNTIDEHLLENSEALMTLASDVEDLFLIRRKVADAFFRNSNKVELRLENLAFSIPSMSDLEVSQVIDRLLTGPYSYDPRSVDDLERLKLFDNTDLLSLVKKTAYPSRSMSSYMIDGALWGEESYVREMVLDTKTNADQPTNFYCAVCGLVISSEGLVASELEDAVDANLLRVQRLDSGEFLLYRYRDGREEL